MVTESPYKTVGIFGFRVFQVEMDVSKNRGAPKWMVKISWKPLFFNG